MRYFLNYRGLNYPANGPTQYFATLEEAQAVRLSAFGTSAYNCAIINTQTGEDVAWKADYNVKD